MSVAVEMTALRARALAVWRLLSTPQQSALRRARVCDRGETRLHHATHKRVADALVLRKLVSVSPSMFTRAPIYTLEPAAMLVREVGLDADATDAKRRYRARRKAAS